MKPFYLIFLIFTFSISAQGSWPDKHGPGLNGIVPSDSTNLPTEWDIKSKKNISWSAPLEGSGHSSPVISEGKVWLTAANDSGTKQYIYCIDEKTGKVLNHKLLFENKILIGIRCKILLVVTGKEFFDIWVKRICSYEA